MTLDRKLLTKEDERFLDETLFPFHGPYAMIAAYLDESGTHEGSSVLCVTGAFYDIESRNRLNEQWGEELKRFGIRRFHMKEQAHLTGEFAGRTRVETDDLYRRLLGILVNNVKGSVTICSIPKKYQPDSWPYTPYLVCSYLCMFYVLKISERLGHERVSFVVETGPEMGRLYDLMKCLPKEDHRWAAMVETYSFMPKDAAPAIQTADVLAYEMYKRANELVNPSGREMRKSLESIIGHSDDHVLEVVDEMMVKNASAIIGRSLQ